ncbi:MAG TPA: GNAT family N-acetyltransferase [Stellaceae bacterium]|jgi:acetyltransferase|nr:GNAT family N-acetyltransferase [Stellaceae bacterium]
MTSELEPFCIRPIRPEDEEALIDMVAHMTPEDRRMRFFATIGGLSHMLAARLSHMDGVREVALVAQLHASDAIVGVARFSADAGGQNAEFAVTVRSDLKGKGIGWSLMEKLVEEAHRCRIAHLSGLVLRENTTMLRFCRDFGFTIEADADDPGTFRATLVLSKPDT